MNPQPIKIQDIDGFWHTDFYYQAPISNEIKHHVETTYLKATKGYKRKALRKAKMIQERVIKSLQSKSRNLSQIANPELDSKSIESRDVINLETKLKLITKRNGYWHMNFTYVDPKTKKQKRYRGSTKLLALSQNKPEALRMALEMRNVLLHSKNKPKTKPKKQTKASPELFSTIASNYMETLKAKGLKQSTLKSYDSILRIHLLPKFGDTPVSQITTRIVDMWFATLKGMNNQPLSSKTRDNIINFFSEILSKALAWKLCKENPVKLISRSKNDDTEMLFWSIEERDTFLKTTAQKSPKFFPIFATFLFTGMRVGEILALRWEHVDLSKKTIHVQKNFVVDRETSPKSGKSRKVQICSWLLKVLQKYQHETKQTKGLLFSRSNGRHLSNGILRTPFLQLCKEAQVKQIRMHDMRHTFASLALMDGVDVPTLQKWLGHKDIQTTMRYIKLLPEHMQKQSKKINPKGSLWKLYQTEPES